MTDLVTIIRSADPAIRDRSLDSVCREKSLPSLLAECAALEDLRHSTDNLYEKVRSLFFLYALHRFHIPPRLAQDATALIPYDGYSNLLQRRFESAIRRFLRAQAESGPSDSISSALADAYRRLGFQTLADQVRRSVRSARGNQWMFRVGHPLDQPLRVVEQLRRRSPNGLSPILREATPVRMDLSHSAWSDIFFLGMDYPEGARVLNVSIDLAVHGRDAGPRPPVEAYLRVIDEPVIRLSSVDLASTVDVSSLTEVFEFADDYLGLLKAAVIASGIVPPGIEGSGEALSDLLARVVGPGNGIELVSQVNGIPKGSRLAVSTNLLASLIAVCMRATGQTRSLVGRLEESERRVVASRAILGEWLAGSGGGWQDSGGVWPGMKLICGAEPEVGEPEFGVSRGRLLPTHHILSVEEASEEARKRLQDSLVLVHGGMAANVGPILEMVTEKYLLRSEPEWSARRDAGAVLDEVRACLRAGDVRGIGTATTRNFFGPIQTIIPQASSLFTETLIDRVRDAFGEDFWGFWMLGGASGGGMGFIFDPTRRDEAKVRVEQIMREAKRELENALPFAIEPIVYDFAINERGTCADLSSDAAALMPPGYYVLTLPDLLRRDPLGLSDARRAELAEYGAASRVNPGLADTMRGLFDRMVPSGGQPAGAARLSEVLDELGFDRGQHEVIRADLRSGRIGLAQNRLPARIVVEDASAGDVADLTAIRADDALRERGGRLIGSGGVAVVTMAAGIGSRWTEGAGVVKAISPFCKLAGTHRTFLEIHLAKSRRVGTEHGCTLPHVVTTSYLTHDPIQGFLDQNGSYGYPGPLVLSRGRAVGLRMIPMVRDLRFAWEEMPQQVLDDQAQKVRESLRISLIRWAQQAGEGGDYSDNAPQQCLHPVGHWYEVPNMLRNGVLAKLLESRPSLEVLVLHNVDTVGMDVDPALLAWHLQSGSAMTVEVIRRRVEDRGGGLASVDGRLRLVEGLAMPREEDEFRLTYYNTGTMWITIDRLLAAFGLARSDLQNDERVSEAVRGIAARMPTYVTLKDVTRRWGAGQGDVMPVAQFERLWGDMTALPGFDCKYVEVPRVRGQQLKDVAQLDGWLRDGSAEYVANLCRF